MEETKRKIEKGLIEKYNLTPMEAKEATQNYLNQYVNQQKQVQKIHPEKFSSHSYETVKKASGKKVGGIKKESWVEFCKIYADKKKCTYREALKEAGPLYKKYQEENKKKIEGGGIAESIGDFLWKHFAKPLGKLYYKSIFGDK